MRAARRSGCRDSRRAQGGLSRYGRLARALPRASAMLSSRQVPSSRHRGSQTADRLVAHPTILKVDGHHLAGARALEGQGKTQGLRYSKCEICRLPQNRRLRSGLRLSTMSRHDSECLHQGSITFSQAATYNKAMSSSALAQDAIQICPHESLYSARGR